VLNPTRCSQTKTGNRDGDYREDALHWSSYSRRGRAILRTR
jgi:hypothetical protein